MNQTETTLSKTQKTTEEEPNERVILCAPQDLSTCLPVPLRHEPQPSARHKETLQEERPGARSHQRIHSVDHRQPKSFKLKLIHDMCDDHISRSQLAQPAVDNLLVDYVVADYVVADYVVADYVVADYVVADYVVADYVVADYVVADYVVGD